MRNIFACLHCPPTWRHLSVSPNRTWKLSCLSLGLKADCWNPVNHLVPQDLCSLQGMHGAMALHSFNQFNKMVSLTMRAGMSWALSSSPELFHPNSSGRRMESSPPHTQKDIHLSHPPNGRLSHIFEAKLQPLPSDNLGYIQKFEGKEDAQGNCPLTINGNKISLLLLK